VKPKLGVGQVLVSAKLVQLVNPVFTFQLIVLSIMIEDVRSAKQELTVHRLMKLNAHHVKLEQHGALLVLRAATSVSHVNQVFTSWKSATLPNPESAHSVALAITATRRMRVAAQSVNLTISV